MAELPPPPDGIVLTHFIVSDDVERSRRFYTEVLGGRVERAGDPVNVALANSWIVINGGGGPTDDKPTVTLETPPDPDRVSSFLNIRVKDIDTVYAEWSARGGCLPVRNDRRNCRVPAVTRSIATWPCAGFWGR
jgi:predicted enzyme related to lactoylglutathione lyase